MVFEANTPELGQILLIYWEYQILLSICIWPQIPNTFKVFVFDPKYQILNLVKYYFKYSLNTFLKENLSFSSLCTQLSILPWKSCMESQQRSKNAKTCTTIKYDSKRWIIWLISVYWAGPRWGITHFTLKHLSWMPPNLKGAFISLVGICLV